MHRLAVQQLVQLAPAGERLAPQLGAGLVARRVEAIAGDDEQGAQRIRWYICPAAWPVTPMARPICAQVMPSSPPRR
jgi:hypothetical protein